MTARPGMRVVVVLLAGRSAFRGSVVLSAPLLLAIWGTETFAPYAVAVGTTLVLNPLVGSGAEKSAGLLLARATAVADQPGRARMLGAHLTVAPLIAAVSLLVAVALLARLPGPMDVYVLAAAMNVGFGAVQALVAYWRVLGRPYVDAVSHSALAVATVVGLVLAAMNDIGPQSVLGLQAGAALSIAAILVVALRHRAAGPRRHELAVTARTTALMGANTLLATASVTVVFALLAQRGLGTAASQLYLAVVAYSVLANLFDYLLRVFQPWLTGVLAEGAPVLLRTAERGSRLGLLVLVPLAAAAVVVFSRWVSGTAQAFLVMAAVAPALLTVACLVWLMENLDSRTLLGTVAAGALGLISTAVAGSVLVSSSAMAGAALALLAGAGVTGIGLFPMLHRRVAHLHLNQPLTSNLGRPS